MKLKKIFYVRGLFEEKDSDLLVFLKEEAEKNNFELESTSPYQDNIFGSFPIDQDMERIQKVIIQYQPDIIIAHSLGAYLLLHLDFEHKKILLDPSLSLSDIFLPNTKRQNNVYVYSDSEREIKLKPEFVESLKSVYPIERLGSLGRKDEIDIIGAGRAGYRIAEKYHKALKNSSYTLLPDSDHDFSSKKDQAAILDQLLKKLGG